MFQFEIILKQILKKLIFVLLVVLVSTSHATVPLCSNHFKNTFKLNKLSLQESDALAMSTVRRLFGRWNDTNFEIITQSGTKITGTTKHTRHTYIDSYFSDQPISPLQVQLNFKVKSKEQAQELIEEIYLRHAVWLAAGKNENRIPQTRINLPQEGSGQILKFEILNLGNGYLNVRILAEYSTEPTIANSVYLELFSALFFTGIKINSEKLTPPPRRFRVDLDLHD